MHGVGSLVGLGVVLFSASAILFVSCGSAQLENRIVQDLLGPDATIVGSICPERHAPTWLGNGNVEFLAFRVSGAEELQLADTSFVGFDTSLYLRTSGPVSAVFRTWVPTPIEGKQAELYETFRDHLPLSAYPCFQNWIGQAEAEKPGNYVASIGGRSTGIWFFLFVPSDSSLFVIRKRE